VAAVVTLSLAPPWAWVLAGVVVLPLLARAGRPAGKPIVTGATLPAAVQAPSQDVITRALGALGIAGIDRWLRDATSWCSRRRCGRTARGGALR
jgi:S-DNA-T family DNA segregation ATPase FtsK/SpoIIIE